MSMTGVESVVRSVISVLKNGMATKLAALKTLYDAEFSDGVALPAPAATDYYWYRPDLLPAYPAVIVTPMPETASDKDLAAGYDFAFAIQLDVVVPATDPAAAEVLLWRYWRAVKELLTANNAIAGADCNLQAVDWNQPAWTPEGFSGPVKDVPGLFIISTTERA